MIDHPNEELGLELVAGRRILRLRQRRAVLRLRQRTVQLCHSTAHRATWFVVILPGKIPNSQCKRKCHKIQHQTNMQDRPFPCSLFRLRTRFIHWAFLWLWRANRTQRFFFSGNTLVGLNMYDRRRQGGPFSTRLDGYCVRNARRLGGRIGCRFPDHAGNFGCHVGGMLPSSTSR